MSSSISASDKALPVAESADRRRWLGWLAMFGGVGAGVFALLLLFLVLVDPYDSGRFPSIGIAGVDDTSPRTANVSLGRDPQFDAAVIGDSTGQLLHPARLSQLTGLSFVQLSVPGSRPQEQIALLNWFIRSHAHVSALVLVADLPWCTQDASLPLEHPFPFWLYSESDIGYLRNLFSERSIERAFRRIGMALGWRERNRTAGYFDYEAWSRAHGRSFVPPPIPPRPESISPLPEPNLPFPAMDRLDRLLASLAQLPPIVLVMPPTYASLIPAAGTAEAAWLENCKSRLTRLAEGPQRRFIDRMVDGPATRNPENFVNELHMRDVLAREIETAIAAPLKQTKRVP